MLQNSVFFMPIFGTLRFSQMGRRQALIIASGFGSGHPDDDVTDVGRCGSILVISVFEDKQKGITLEKKQLDYSIKLITNGDKQLCTTSLLRISFLISSYHVSCRSCHSLLYHTTAMDIHQFGGLLRIMKEGFPIGWGTMTVRHIATDIASNFR